MRNSNPLQQEADSKSLTDKAAFEALKLNDSKSLATALGDKNRVSSLIHSLVSQEIPSFDVRGAVIQNPGDFATLCQSIRTPLFESLKVAVLDANGTVLRSQILHVGSLNESVASFQRVLGLLGDNEKRVIISHNHPSGDPSPSNADLRLHQSFVEKSKLVGVEIMDHVITNGRRYYSIENHEIGYLKDPVKAKWENTAREDLIHLNPGDISGVFDLLRNASPSAGHIIYVNTKTAITALERYPQDGATASLELAKMIIRGAAREGAYGVFVDHPPSMPQMDAQMLNARLVRLLESSGVKFWDARWSGLQPGATAHQVGIMEEPIQSQELAKATMQRKASTLEEAATAAKEFAGKLIKNDSTGMEASVSGNTIRKMTQEKSVSKSIAAKIHAMALANIDQLFKNADLIQVHPDKNEDINIASIHRFAAPMIVDSMVYPVKITVKEFNHPKENRIYTVEALDVEKAKPAGIRADDTSAKANAEQSVPQAGFDDKIKALQEKVNAGEPSQPSDDIRSHYTLPDLVDDVKAGRTDGPLKAVNEIVANSNELMKRRRAASEKRKGPRATGKLSIIDSITRAAKAERINPQTAQVLTDFINKLDDRFLENESISLRKGAGGGYYEFGSHLVTLLTDSRDVTHTGIHEFWHSLSRLLPEDELEKMKGDYQRALSDYIQKNPDFYALVGREQLTPEQFKEYQFFAGDKAEQNTRPIYASGEVIGYKIAFTQENYRFKSLDEWVVENLTDEILGKDKANAQTPSTPWQRFVQALKDLFSKLRDTLGFNHYKNFADNVFERPEKMDFEREGPLAKEQALYQPDNAKQSNIRNARPEEDPNQLAFHFKEGDNAADRIKQNIGLVDHLANQFRNIPGVEQDDVRSRARIALVKAAQQYDPSKGNFAPYASQSIRNGLKDLFGEQVRHVSTHLTTLDEMNPATEEPNSANVPDSTQNVEKQATSNDARQVLDKATSRLPAPLQLVIKGLEKGETLETIGRDYLNGASRQQVYNLSKTATAGLRRILGELGIKSVDDAISLNSLKQPDADNQFDPYEAIAALQRLAAAEEPGERTIGRPDLAHGADDPAIMGVDEFRKSTAKPQTVEQWKADAEKMLADDYEGMKQKIIDIGLQPGGSLSAPETMAAKMIVAQELKKAYADPTDKTARNNLQILVNAYRQTGTEQARGMRARVDEFKTPADRHREFLGKMIFSPAPLQAKLNASKTPEERQEILNKDRERLDKIEKALGEMGVSLNDILNGETVMRLKGARFISNALKSFPEKEAEAIKMYQDNKPLTAILKKTGLNKTQMEAAIDKLRTEFLKKHLDKFKAGAKADSVEMDALAARAPGDLKQTVSDAEALAEAMKAFESMGFRPTEKQGKKQFDITKPEDAVEAARAIQAADGNAFDMVREYWINAILSGPVTHTGIFSAVAGRIAWNNTVGRASEALVNSALGVIGQGDKDAAQWGEFKYVMQGLAPALSSAATDALKAFNSETSLFKHRHDPDSKLDDHMFPVSIPGKLGRVIRIPGRVIQTLDEYFKTLTGRLEAGAQAYRMAKGEGLKGDAIQKRVEALIADPHSEAWQRSIASALHDLFQTEIRSHKDGANLVEGMAHGVMSLTKDFTPAQFVIPFVRIGYNILAAGVQSSPLGSIYMAQRFAKDGFYHFAKGKVNPNPYLKSEMIRDLAGQLIAWTAGALLWGAVEGDKDDDKKKLIMTGSESPGDKRSGNRLLAQRRGLPAYTIQYRGADGKDQSFYYGRYEPDATVLGTTVDMIRGLKDHARGATAPDAFIGFLQRMSGQFTEKSYARGLSELANLLSNPKANAYDWVSHIASSFVPNIITQPMRGLDPYERDNHIEAGDTKTLIKQFMAQTVSQALPGMSGQPAKVDAYGRDVVKNGSGIFRVLAPGNPHEQMAVQKADDLLANWKIQSHDDAPESLKDWAPAQPARTFTQGGKKVTMSTQEYHDMKAQAGKIVMQQLAGRITGSMVEKPTLRDVQMIKQAFEAAHRQALEQVKAKHPGAAPDLSRIMWAQ